MGRGVSGRSVWSPPTERAPSSADQRGNNARWASRPTQEEINTEKNPNSRETPHESGVTSEAPGGQQHFFFLFFLFLQRHRAMFGIPAACLWVSVVGVSANRRHWSDRLASLPRCHICNPLCNPENIYFILVYQWKNCPGIVQGIFFLLFLGQIL